MSYNVENRDGRGRKAEMWGDVYVLSCVSGREETIDYGQKQICIHSAHGVEQL